MKLILLEEPGSELEVQIRYPVRDAEVDRLIERIEDKKPRIMGTTEEENRILSLDEIYYAESVDRKTFLYTKEQVYRCNKKIYQLLEEWKDYGFIQTGKAAIVNMNQMVNVKVLWNSRLEATLVNDEKIIISRTYIKAVRDWLESEEGQE